MKSFFIKRFTLIIIICITIIAVDQVTKDLAMEKLSQSIAITTFFSLTLAFNKGISFGIFNNPEQQQAILIGINILITIALLANYFMAKNRIAMVGISMIVTGAIGNIIDRVMWGAVVDFIDLHLQGYHFPIFNVADIAICLGCTLFAYSEYKLHSQKKHSKNAKN